MKQQSKNIVRNSTDEKNFIDGISEYHSGAVYVV